MNPEITVYIPSKSYGHYVREAIESVLRQTRTDWELILIDNDSVDETSQVFKEYDFDPEVQNDIINFMDENKHKLREMSLRMALKIADLRKLSVLNWKRLAETTCMKVA